MMKETGVPKPLALVTRFYEHLGTTDRVVAPRDITIANAFRQRCGHSTNEIIEELANVIMESASGDRSFAKAETHFSAALAKYEAKQQRQSDSGHAHSRGDPCRACGGAGGTQDIDWLPDGVVPYTYGIMWRQCESCHGTGEALSREG